MRVKNPILKGFHPDPCICKAKDTYYIATSTFEYFPGINIHASKDLVHWELVAHPLDSSKIINMMNNSPSSGVWAPDLTYHNGLFYIVFSNMQNWALGPFKDSQNFIITSPYITGPWSQPVYVNSSGFDASLFHDDDGKLYFVNMEWDYRGMRGAPCFTGILITPLDPKTFEVIGKTTKIFKGTERGFVEGPHIYKKDGYYYLFCAEGGTGYNHAESVCRSRNIYGPYELHPNKLLISSKGTNANLQKAGHASLVDGGAEGWFLAHLCGRPNANNRCILGRETALQNIVWRDNWPYLKDSNGVPRDFYEVSQEMEIVEENRINYQLPSKDFLLDFQTLRKSMNAWIAFENNKIILTGKESISSYHNQNTFCRRVEHKKSAFLAHLEFEPTSFQQMAGIMIRYQEGDLAYLYVSFDEQKGKVLKALRQESWKTEFFEEEIKVPHDVYLKAVVDGDNGMFYYSFDGISYAPFGHSFDISCYSDEIVQRGGFTGLFFAISASDLEYYEKKAAFSNISYLNLEE